MIYLDTSAMVKLVVRENESEALIDWINDLTDSEFVESAQRGVRPARTDCCTAEIGRIELLRAALRVGNTAQPIARGTQEAATAEPDAAVAARRVLERVDVLLMTPEISTLAETVAPADLRTLDAVHLATVLANQSIVSTVCAYDHRLIEACAHHGIEVASPGAN
ncbi:type II toxin-antitoxin system VapC family toxin [Mycolicibacterium palauense]|uniref:type II toxin-antitoxin system VapC family toxin n=1 Tax=Mycolicibacterium palauense TaxID=2034511 RepID=UPI000BFEF6E9|nr:type II toxin-antitoxin system VapC family toxin [Mycolicibacterium palauense]